MSTQESFDEIHAATATSGLEREYREKFGEISESGLANPGLVFNSYDTISHHTIVRSIGEPVLKQEVVLFSGARHSHVIDADPNLCKQVTDAWGYIKTKTDPNKLLLLVEGRKRNPRLDLPNADILLTYGEIGLMEALALRDKVPEVRIQHPEPTGRQIKELALQFSARYPDIDYLGLAHDYLVLRKLAQTMFYFKAGSQARSINTALYLLTEESLKVLDLPRYSTYMSPAIRDRWNASHPHAPILPLEEPTDKLLRALVKQTTIECIRTPKEQRTVMQNFVIDITMLRQLSLAFAIETGLDQGLHVAYCGGGPHRKAIDYWLANGALEPSTGVRLRSG